MQDERAPLLSVYFNCFTGMDELEIIYESLIRLPPKNMKKKYLYRSLDGVTEAVFTEELPASWKSVSPLSMDSELPSFLKADSNIKNYVYYPNGGVNRFRPKLLHIRKSSIVRHIPREVSETCQENVVSTVHRFIPAESLGFHGQKKRLAKCINKIVISLFWTKAAELNNYIVASGGKKYPCRLCSYTSFSLPSIAMHYHRRHDIDSHSYMRVCTYCKYMCSETRIMKKHMTIHD